MVRSVALLGVDVGLAEIRRSTGLAWLLDGKIQTAVTGSSWHERARDLPQGIKFALAAIDAPILSDRENRARGREVVWLVLSEPEMWDARGMTVAWLEAHAELEERREWTRVSLARYRLLPVEDG